MVAAAQFSMNCGEGPRPTGRLFLWGQFLNPRFPRDGILGRDPKGIPVSKGHMPIYPDNRKRFAGLSPIDFAPGQARSDNPSAPREARTEKATRGTAPSESFRSVTQAPSAPVERGKTLSELRSTACLEGRPAEKPAPKPDVEPESVVEVKADSFAEIDKARMNRIPALPTVSAPKTSGDSDVDVEAESPVKETAKATAKAAAINRLLGHPSPKSFSQVLAKD